MICNSDHTFLGCLVWFGSIEIYLAFHMIQIYLQVDLNQVESNYSNHVYNDSNNLINLGS